MSLFISYHAITAAHSPNVTLSPILANDEEDKDLLHDNSNEPKFIGMFHSASFLP